MSYQHFWIWVKPPSHFLFSFHPTNFDLSIALWLKRNLTGPTLNQHVLSLYYRKSLWQVRTVQHTPSATFWTLCFFLFRFLFWCCCFLLIFFSVFQHRQKKMFILIFGSLIFTLYQIYSNTYINKTLVFSRRFSVLCF